MLLTEFGVGADFLYIGRRDWLGVLSLDFALEGVYVFKKGLFHREASLATVRTIVKAINTLAGLVTMLPACEARAVELQTPRFRAVARG